ncbi:MAG: insulinase family protein [Paludibacteraceae bacterium]|nr:insulinase family protein [Paludibacteraceae bacterium]
MYDTFYKILANGVRIVHRKSTSQVAYVGVMVGIGTRDEQADQSGLAHYIEHCVFKGAYTPNRHPLSANNIINQVEGIGGEINAYTTKEETTFYAATPTQHWKRTLSLIANIVLRPSFPKSETSKEVEVILDEIDSYEDSPSELIYDDFEGLIFQGHRLASPILGTKKSVRQIAKDPQTAIRFMQQLYTPERMVVFVQGDIPAEQVEHTVEQLFSHLPAAALDVQTLRTAPDTLCCQHKNYKKHTHQVHVMLGGRAYSIEHPQRRTLYLLNNILGGGSMSSRLNMVLREKKGLVYTIESQYTPLSDTGYWSIYFASDSKDKSECMQLVLNQLRLLREQPLTPQQLRKALQQLHGQMAISAENQENNVLAMAKLMLYHNCAPTWQETFRAFERITIDDLTTVAREIYDESNISVLSYE